MHSAPITNPRSAEGTLRRTDRFLLGWETRSHSGSFPAPTMASSTPSAPAQTHESPGGGPGASPERPAPGEPIPQPRQRAALGSGLGWAGSTGGALCALPRPPSGQWPRALWRGSGSPVALCEALGKWCGSLYLGCPGARRPLETAARRDQHAPRPPPALGEQGPPRQSAVASPSLSGSGAA